MTSTLPREVFQAADAAFQDCRHRNEHADMYRIGDCCLRAAVTAALDHHAAEEWARQQADQLGIRYADFRAGRWEMELSMAREMAAAYVAMAKTLLGDAPNYSETKLHFDVKIAESPEMYTLVVQRHAPGALTPHEARQRAEARLERVVAAVRKSGDRAVIEAMEAALTAEEPNP